LDLRRFCCPIALLQGGCPVLGERTVKRLGPQVRSNTTFLPHLFSIKLRLGPIPSTSHLFSCFISHHGFVDHPDLDQAIDGRGLRCIERKGAQPAATLGRRRLGDIWGLICPPAIVQSLRSLELNFLSIPRQKPSCGIHSPMDLFGPLSNLCLDFGHIFVLRRTVPSKYYVHSTPGQPRTGTSLATKSRAL
jgi:hypothetical protein